MYTFTVSTKTIILYTYKCLTTELSYIFVLLRKYFFDNTVAKFR